MAMGPGGQGAVRVVAVEEYLPQTATLLRDSQGPPYLRQGQAFRSAGLCIPLALVTFLRPPDQAITAVDVIPGYVGFHFFIVLTAYQNDRYAHGIGIGVRTVENTIWIETHVPAHGPGCVVIIGNPNLPLSHYAFADGFNFAQSPFYVRRSMSIDQIFGRHIIVYIGEQIGKTDGKQEQDRDNAHGCQPQQRLPAVTLEGQPSKIQQPARNQQGENEAHCPRQGIYVPASERKDRKQGPEGIEQGRHQGQHPPAVGCSHFLPVDAGKQTGQPPAAEECHGLSHMGHEPWHLFTSIRV